MTDVEERAGRAGTAAREQARVLVARMPHPADIRRTRTRGRLLAAATVTAVVAVVIGLVVTDGRVPVVDGVGPDPAAPVAFDGVLPVPEEDDVLAAYLEDGTPVFVSRLAEDEVHVVHAVDPHDAYGNDKLVAYCPSNGWFEDLWHGSKFSARGDWMGGPAPTGLPVYPSELGPDGSTVTLTGTSPTPAERDEPRGERYEPRGPSCSDSSDSAHPVVAHRPPQPVAPVSGRDVPADRWTWSTVVVGGEPGRLVACDADGTCPPDSPRVAADVNQPDGTLIDRTPAVYLARTGADGMVELLRPARPDDHRLPRGEEAEPFLAVPARGEVSATYLADGTPVFVSHTAGGTVHVLDPTSPSVPAELVAWCGSTGRFTERGSTFGPDGGPIAGSATTTLGSYPYETVDLGESTALRITGEALTEVAPPRPATQPSADRCESGLVAHAPATDTFVHEQGTSVNGEGWMWVRMRIASVGEGLYLCSLGRHVPGCGEPSDDQTVCPGTDHDGSPAGCHPLRDPVVTTEGAEATDGPVLLLVRGDPEGRTVEIRRPAATPSDGPGDVAHPSAAGDGRIETFRGAEHCGWQSVDVVRVATDVAPAQTGGDAWVDYVRDPAGVLPDRVVFDTLDLDAELPERAVDSGLRTPDGAELWLDPDRPTAAYFVDDGRVERWPAASPGCD